MISLPASTVFSSEAAVAAAVVSAAVASAVVAGASVAAVVALVVLLLPQPANMDMTIRTVSASANTFFIVFTLLFIFGLPKGGGNLCLHYSAYVIHRQLGEYTTMKEKPGCI